MLKSKRRRWMPPRYAERVEIADSSQFNAAEMDSWIAFGSVLTLLPAALDAELQRVAELSHFEYQVLSMLAELPDRTMRMSNLASFANSSLSRLSHSATRLESRGFMTRTPDPTDGRFTLATLSDQGWCKVTSATPQYVAVVRSLVFESLTKQQTVQLGEVGRRIMRAIEPGHECMGPAQWMSQSAPAEA